MAVKRSLWDTILKVVIAVASAVLGALGGNAMNLQVRKSQVYKTGG